MPDTVLEFRFASAEDALTSSDQRLVDIVDGLLDHGVVLRAEVWLTVADVDLVFLGTDIVLSNPDSLRPTKGRLS